MFGFVVISENFEVFESDPETKHIFFQAPLISFKRDKNLGNFLVRSAFKFNNQPGTFTCKRTGYKNFVPLFLTQLTPQDPIDPFKSLIILHTCPLMSSIAKPARYARKAT